MARKLDGSYITANTITTTQLTTTVVNQISAGGGPKVTTITYPNSATAAVNTGNESIVLTGTGFESGVQVYINGSAAPSVSRTNSSSLSFTTPALSTGTTYPLYVVNPDGGTAVVVPGMVVSAGPVWITGSPLASWGASSALSRQLQANSDSTVSYALADGSSLPSGLSLAANGLLSGTLTSPPAQETIYNFTVTATDLELQKSSKAFSINATLAIEATGGTVTNIAGYRVHTFTSSGTFDVTSGSGTVEYLVVAGGGSGGTAYAGGGGAGGFRTGTGLAVAPGPYTVTVGGGGAAASAGPTHYAGNPGSNSSFSTITSIGGGGGGAVPSSGLGSNGGSGGGGGFAIDGGATRAGGTGTPGQGYNGGSGSDGPVYGGGGGGGAGAAGGEYRTAGPAAGGAGLATTITGSSTTYAGGGGGGTYTGTSPAGGGAGGAGGGGAGGFVPGVGNAGVAGTVNTGGGGGGGGGSGQGNQNSGSGAGGSGIVIIRYAA